MTTPQNQNAYHPVALLVATSCMAATQLHAEGKLEEASAALNFAALSVESIPEPEVRMAATDLVTATGRLMLATGRR